MRIISNKQLRKKLNQAFEAGQTQGYELGYKMGQTESQNRAILHSSKMEQTIEKIIKGEGGKT